MPDEPKKIDAFKPAQPFIPGVPAQARKSAPQEPPPESTAHPAAIEDDQARPAPAQHLTWIVAAAVAVCSVGGALLIWHNISSHATGPTAAPATVAPEIAAEPMKPARDLAIGPGPIATTDELGKPWANKRFLFPDSVSGQPVTAMVVHLPNGSYWAFSMTEPFGNCALEYVTDLDRLRDDYNFVAAHPMVVNTCNRTVYDLMRYGGPSESSLVRGEVVQGPGLRPPMAIEVRTEGKHIIAVRME